ncbi:MAG: beta-ketoacyl synthase N-terminal-like domain-containing protein [Gemmataceae bacterium]
MSASCEPIAIVGMQCLYPGAGNLESYWRNIALGVDAIREVPPSRWNPSDYDLIHSRHGGFLDGLTAFDPLDYGIMPASVQNGDPEQFLVYGVIHGALRDMLTGRQFRATGISSPGTAAVDPLTPRTEVVIGRGGYNGNTIEMAYLRMEFVAQVGELLGQLIPGVSREKLNEIRNLLATAFPHRGNTEMLASSIPNLTSGRVANRLDFQGGNYTVDAACASGLIATDLVIRALRERRADLGVAAAVHLVQKPYFWFAFELLQALSPSGKCKPFSNAPDGLVIGEGIGAVILKRLDDAQRDGDRIYAVLRAVGTASDGKAMGILTPRQEGQVLATRRAYEESGVNPSSISLIEGHGTAMPVGDATEIATLLEVFGPDTYPSVALGSVKSMLGHLMPAAGMAGLIKTALAVYHRAIPPTLNVEAQAQALQGSRFYVNTRLRPWIAPHDQPRRAGVNAFGFGGINTHAILEDLPGDEPRENLLPRSCELFVLAAPSRAALVDQLNRWLDSLGHLTTSSLRDICFTAADALDPAGSVRLSVVADSLATLLKRLTTARDRLSTQHEPSWNDDTGLAFAEAPYPGKLAFLFPGLAFPGLAAGYTERLGQLALHFPEVRWFIDFAEGLSRSVDPTVPYPLSHQFYPPPLSDAQTLARLERELIWSKRTPLGQMNAGMATWNLLRALQVEPAALAGFSMGEWAALAASGVLSQQDLRDMLSIWQSLGDVPEQLTGLWGMVGTTAERVEAVLQRVPGTAAIIMDPSPTQTFFAGEAGTVRAALEQLRSEGVFVQEIPFPAIHTPLAASIVEGLRAVKGAMPANPPRCRVYCGMNGKPYPDDPDVIRDWIIDSFKEPLRGKETIRNMYHQDGIRIFVELGIGGRSPQSLNTILAGAPHVALAVDWRGAGGLEQFHHLLGRLFVLGVPFDLGYLYRNRPCRRVDRTGTPAPVSRTRLELDLGHPRARVPEESLARLRAMLQPATPLSPAAASPAPVPAPVAVRPPTGPLGEVMATMQQFLHVQQQLETSESQMLAAFLNAQQTAMAALFAGGPSLPTAPQANGAVAPAAPPLPAWPFTGEVVRMVPGKELETRLVLDVGQHFFLGDHSFIKVPEEIKPCEERLPTLPMTFGMEIICEIAAQLVPELQVVSCHDVEASRWIALISQRTLPLNLRARRLSETEVEVEVRTPDSDRPVLKGRVTLGSALPAAPAPRLVQAPQPCPHRAEELYTVPFMFHGPRFHVVSKLLGQSESTLLAELTLRDPAELVAGSLTALPLFDPVLVDGVGQVVGYKLLVEDWVVYPLRLGRLTRYGPTPPPGSVVRLHATYRKLDGRRVEMEADVLDPAGRVWLRLNAWQVWRILWPRELSAFSRQPRTQRVGVPWPTRHADADCCRMVSRLFGEISPEWIARYCLPASEWALYKAAPRFDWLLARIAVKDAVRDLFKRHRGEVLLHLEIEIREEADGRLEVVHPREEGLAIAVAGDAEEAIALCARARGVGVALVRGAVSAASRSLAAKQALSHALRAPATDPWVIGSPNEQGLVEIVADGTTHVVETSSDGDCTFAVAVVR